MLENSPKTRKSLLTLAAIVPLIVLVLSFAFWVDTRYMHKNISDVRFIDGQMLLLEGHVENYEMFKQLGFEPSERDERRYRMKLIQLQQLRNERNKLMGIGEGQ